MTAEKAPAGLAALVLCAGCAGGEAAPAPPPGDVQDAPPPEDLSALLQPMRAATGIPALAAAVFSPDGLVAIGADGRRRADEPGAVSTGDRFHLGSCAKAMTATLAAILVEQGATSWDATAGGVLGTLVADVHPELRAVTLRSLLAHRAGIDDARVYAERGLLQKLIDGLGAADPLEAQRLRLSGEVLSVAPAVEPGTAFQYSNLGYLVAGTLLEQAAGASFEDLLRSELLDPLGMASCGFGPPARAEPRGQPWGHVAGAVPVPPDGYGDSPPVLAPAGTLHCALADWARFVAQHLAGPRGESALLSAGGFAVLHGPDPALGWYVGFPDWARGPLLAHPGAGGIALGRADLSPSFFAHASAAPGLGLGAVVAVNYYDFDGTSEALVDRVLVALTERFAGAR